MTHTEIIKDIKAGQVSPLYFLYGAESYYIDKVVDYIEHNLLNETERAFNQQVLYGKDVKAMNILDAAARLPMMAERQLVIVKEAQEVRDIDLLSGYISAPAATTVLVLVFKHKSPDKRKSFFKELIRKSVSLESKPLYDNQVPDWIAKYVREKGKQIEPACLNMLTEYLGTDLQKISNELDKLLLNKKDDSPITMADVDLYIGISKDYNVFNLQKAIGMRDVTKANRIVLHFERNPKNNPFVMVVANLFSYFSNLYLAKSSGLRSSSDIASLLKISPFFAKDYVTAMNNFSLPQIERACFLLQDYDLKSKGVGNVSVRPEALTKELVYRILS